VLAGHSFAGLIAFETARQFQKQGGKVEMVLLFDSWASYPSPYQVAWHNLRDCWKPADRLSRSIGARGRNSWLIALWPLRQEKNRLRSCCLRPALNSKNLTSLSDEPGMPLPGELLRRLYETIWDSYRPRQLDSRGVLFRADSIDEYSVVREFDASLGWENLFTQGLEIIPIVGNHLSMYREQDSNLARKLDEVLAKNS
jgi:pimeloyl-ACP methyl ester carboxylesterase